MTFDKNNATKVIFLHVEINSDTLTILHVISF